MGTKTYSEETAKFFKNDYNKLVLKWPNATVTLFQRLMNKNKNKNIDIYCPYCIVYTV